MNQRIKSIDTTDTRPKAIFKSVCEYPECISCTLISLAPIPPSQRSRILRTRLNSLVQRDCAFIELCLHQLRALVRSILLTPSTLSATLTSPAHTARAPTGTYYRNPETDPRSPSGIVSPCASDKQTEVDLLVDAGIASSLFKVLAAYPRIPFITELALNVLRDLALCNTSDTLGPLWVLGDDHSSALLDLLPVLYHGNSTILSSTLDLLTAIFGTTSIGCLLPIDTLQSVIDSLLILLNSDLIKQPQILSSLHSEPYQATVLGINESQIDAYSYRWANMLVDKASLTLCALIKANYDCDSNLSHFAQSKPLIHMLVKLMSEMPNLPNEYPETDSITNSLIMLVILGPHISDPLLVNQVVTILDLTLQSSPDQFTSPFETLDQHIPAQLLPKNLLSLVDRALASYATITTLLVHLISVLADPSYPSSDCLRVLRNMITQDNLPVLPVSKTIRRGGTPICVLSIPPPLDQALMFLVQCKNSPRSVSFISDTSKDITVAGRFRDTKISADHAFKANAWIEAAMWFYVAATYAQALEQPIHVLLDARCDCLMLVPGMEAKSLECALESLSISAQDHDSVARIRVEQARIALEKVSNLKTLKPPT